MTAGPVTWQVLIVGNFALFATEYFQGLYQPSARELIRINRTTKVHAHSQKTSRALVYCIYAQKKALTWTQRFCQTKVQYLKEILFERKRYSSYLTTIHHYVWFS